MERGLPEAIDSGRIASLSPKERETVLRSEYGWDLLAARSLMAFGPDPLRGPNVLLDDTLPDETDKQVLQEVREALVQGFQWAVREGPLTESPVRGLRFRLIDALLAAEPVYRAPGQIIPTMRRACYSALLTAGPRLMEPVARLEIRCPKECVQVAYEILAKRRGHVLKETPVAGSPLTALRAQVPLLDAAGLETDLRTSTLGGALPQSSVSLAPTWQVVPGDPLDSDIQLVALEPAPAPHLARDLLLKTRRRKGLTADLTIARFFDEPMMAELAREQAAAGLGSLKI
jgi:U5 small nuclear ribonucleoprotein component